MSLFSRRVAPAVVVVGSLLAGCGGGGGGTPTAGFTASDYAQVGDSVADSIAVVASVANTLGDAMTRELAQELGTSPSPRDPVAFVRRLIANAGSGTEQAQSLMTPYSQACPGGGAIRGTATDADKDGKLSQGDSYALVSDQCVIEGQTLVGSITGSVTQATASSGVLALSFNRFGAGASYIDGAATFSYSTGAKTSVALRFQDTRLADIGTSARLSFTATLTAVAAGSVTLALDGGLSLNGDEVFLSQPAPFTFTGNRLQQGGTLQVKEALGARLQLVAGPGYRFTYQYFAPDNVTSTPTSSTTGLYY